MGGAESIAERMNLVLYILGGLAVVSLAALVLSALCVVMIRRILRAETPWQIRVSEKLFPEAPATAQLAQAPPAPAPLAPLPDYAAQRGSSPSDEPEPPSRARATALPRRPRR